MSDTENVVVYLDIAPRIVDQKPAFREKAFYFIAGLLVSNIIHLSWILSHRQELVKNIPPRKDSYGRIFQPSTPGLFKEDVLYPNPSNGSLSPITPIEELLQDIDMRDEY